MRLTFATCAFFSLAVACSGSQTADVKGPQPGPGLKTSATPAGVAIPPPHRVTTVEGITEYRLANGMKVLLFPDDTQSTVTINVTYFVGSRHEGYGETGMAHLLEHMVFKGTTTRADIWKELSDHGAQFNGTTGDDRTNYFETLPATEENVKWAIAMEADRMVNSRIDPAELAKEFSVVRNEFERRENNPVAILSQRISSSAYLWHNYGKSTIGNRSDIERVPASSLRRFYEKYYQPDNAMVVVAGRFDGEKTLEIINKHFGAIAKPTRALEPTYTVEPVQDGERTVVLRRPGGTQAVGLAYHTVAATHADAVALDALDHILTNEPAGRLYKALVAKKLATRVFGRTPGGHDPGVSEFYAEVPLGKNLGAAEKTMIDIVEKLHSTKITDAEVSRFKTSALKSWELFFTNSSRVAVFLSNFAAMGDWRMIFLYRDRLETLKADDVSRVAKAYFKRSNRTTGRFIPTKTPDRAPVVEAPNVAALLDGYKGRGKVAAGEKFEATLANIEKRTERTALKNGMKLALLPKKTRGSAVRAELVIRFARERDLKGKVTAVTMIPQMLMRGTKNRSYQEIRDELNKLKAEVRFGGGGLAGGSPNEVTVSIETTNDNLVKVLELVTEILREPTFPADQFKIVKEEAVASIEKQKDDPQARAFLAILSKLSPYAKNNVRYVPSIDERMTRLKKVRLSDLSKFHAKFYGAAHAEMAIVGDFDAAQVKAALEAGLGKWTSKNKYQRIAMPHKAHKAEKIELNTPDKAMATLVAAHAIKLSDKDADFAALELGAYILGGGQGSSRLMVRLRHKGGLSYTAGGAMQASSHERSGVFFAFAIAAPQNVDKAMAALIDEVTKTSEKGVSDKEVADAIKAYLEAKKGRLSRDGTVASMLREGLELGRTTEFQEKLNAKIAKLTAAEVNAALKKHLKAKRLVRIIAGDLAKRSAP